MAPTRARQSLDRPMIQGMNVRDLGKLIPTVIVAATVLVIVGPALRSPPPGFSPRPLI